MKDDRLYLIHIKECIERIESYMQGKRKQDFLDSELLQDAVVRNLQVLAESTQRLSDVAKERHVGALVPFSPLQRCVYPGSMIVFAHV